MQDSERAARLAKKNGIDTGLHLNLSQSYNGPKISHSISEAQQPIVDFMKRSKYAVLLYHPLLRNNFRRVFKDQLEEFVRLYGKAPTHIDGHQHRHLCANMLLDQIIPRGQKVRRNFSFWPGEKSWFNRMYRGAVDKWLGRRYQLTDFFFSLHTCLRDRQLDRVKQLAQASQVELMVHPIHSHEYNWLLGASQSGTFVGVQKVSFASL